MEHVDSLLILAQTGPGGGGGAAGAAGAGLFFALICILWILGVALGIGAFVFVIWALVDCASNYQGDDKTMWILIIILGGLIGAIIYMAVGRKQNQQRIGNTPPPPPVQVPEYPPYRRNE